MMKKILFCLVAALFVSPVFADVHKWKDANGQTHYGDAPDNANTATVRTDQQTDDQIANGERIKSGTAKLVKQEARDKELATQQQAAQEKKEKKQQDCLTSLRNINKAYKQKDENWGITSTSCMD